MAVRDLDASSVIAVYDELTNAGVSKADAAKIPGRWVIAQAGKDKRTSAYATPLAATPFACAAKFTRSFAHADWIDGESVVQAEQTTIEEGFNRRFHAIENDLDALGVDVKQAFAVWRTCVRRCRQLWRRSSSSSIASTPTSTSAATSLGQPLPRCPSTGIRATGSWIRRVLRSPDATLANAALEMSSSCRLRRRVAIPGTILAFKRTTEIARTFADDKEILTYFKNTPTVTKDDFVKKFGDKRSSAGILDEGAR